VDKFKYKSIETYRACKNRYKTNKRKKERLTSFNYNKVYTEEDIQLILDKTYSDSELAKLLGRQTSAIETKRSKLLKERKDKI